MARRTRIDPLTVAQEEELSEHIWKLSLQGKSPEHIARQLKVSFPIVERLLNRTHQEMRERRLCTAESDLTLVLERLRLQMLNYNDIYNRIVSRLVEEEKQEVLENEARARRGLLPTTQVTRAMKFYLKAVPMALDTIDGQVAIEELRATVLGLEAYGIELARRRIEQKTQELLRLLSTPLEMTLRNQEPVPAEWDDDPTWGDWRPQLPDSGAEGFRQPLRSSEADGARDDSRDTTYLPAAS